MEFWIQVFVIVIVFILLALLIEQIAIHHKKIVFVLLTLLIEQIAIHHKKIGDWIETKNSIKNEIKILFRTRTINDDIPDSMFTFLNKMSKRELYFMRKTIISQFAEDNLK